MTRTLLIDADIFVYRAAFACQRDYDWDGDGDKASVTDFEEAKLAFQDLVDGALADADWPDYVICLSDSEPCYRRDFYPTYKGNRSNRPVLYSDLRQWIIDQPKWRTYLRPRLEADDILGILATHPKLIPGQKIIYSGDKDLRQIPGLHLDVRDGDMVTVTPEEAEHFFLAQVLTGDPVDNYPGCPGIGPVKAARILDTDAPWPAIVAAYEAKGLTADDALIQARCARILRATEYDFKNKEPILWNPPAASTVA